MTNLEFTGIEITNILTGTTSHTRDTDRPFSRSPVACVTTLETSERSGNGNRKHDSGRVIPLGSTVGHTQHRLGNGVKYSCVRGKDRKTGRRGRETFVFARNESGEDYRILTAIHGRFPPQAVIGPPLTAGGHAPLP